MSVFPGHDHSQWLQNKPFLISLEVRVVVFASTRATSHAYGMGMSGDSFPFPPVNLQFLGSSLEISFTCKTMSGHLCVTLATHGLILSDGNPIRATVLLI